MNELFSEIQPKLDENRNWDYSNYMTEHFPRRISGMGDDRRASEWIVEKFRSFGLEAEIVEYTAYNSNPVGSFVKVLEPETVTLESRPCCHISSTPLEELSWSFCISAPATTAIMRGRMCAARRSGGGLL